MEHWEETRIGVIGSVDSGKCFGINTIIKVDKTRLITIQDVKPGMSLIGADNFTMKTVARVTTGKSKLFRVTQSNGNNYIINEYHIMCLKLMKLSDFARNIYQSVSLYHFENNTIDIDLQEYFKLPNIIREHLYGFDCDENSWELLLNKKVTKGFSF